MKHFILLLFLFLGFTSCTVEETIAPTDSELELTAFNQEVVGYFKEVALGFEFGNASRITRKWGNNDMKIFVGGSPTVELENELNKIVTEINILTTDGFTAEVVTDSSASNFYVFFGSGDEYAAIFPAQKSNAESNWGLFSVFWNGNNNLIRGYMYVDIFRANATEQKHLLREELTQSLGLARDSGKYRDSIFQQNWTTTTSYSPIDKELIRLLYHPQITSGFTAQQVEVILRNILMEEQRAM